MDDPKMYSTSEIAAKFGIKATYFRKKRQLNQGPKYLKLGRKVLYHQSDIEAWLKASISEVVPCSEGNKQCQI